MSDRELLELAAKAAGVKIERCSCSNEQWPFRYAPGQPKRGHWNPLVSDGDALRLAVKLRLLVDVPSEGNIHQTVEVVAPCVRNFIYEPCGTDAYAATRRAIVRAAAAIGEKQ
ncbi:hypothetical protein [Cupriavidus necator]|uniref:hypothetical protein n=1 Tax=Cupriavidus necator TaxID=106590 RepID=UPI00339D8173